MLRKLALACSESLGLETRGSAVIGLMGKEILELLLDQMAAATPQTPEASQSKPHPVSFLRPKR
jgi:hypothetical protein